MKIVSFVFSLDASTKCSYLTYGNELCIEETDLSFGILNCIEFVVFDLTTKTISVLFRKTLEIYFPDEDILIEGDTHTQLRLKMSKVCHMQLNACFSRIPWIMNAHLLELFRRAVYPSMEGIHNIIPAYARKNSLIMQSRTGKNTLNFYQKKRPLEEENIKKVEKRLKVIKKEIEKID